MKLIHIVQKKEIKNEYKQKDRNNCGSAIHHWDGCRHTKCCFYDTYPNGPDFLIKVSANENQFIIAALFVLLMGLALAMVPVMLFPIFKKHNEALALGYVVFRGALETVTDIAMVISWLFLLVVSREYVAAGAPMLPIFKPWALYSKEMIRSVHYGNRFQPGRSDALLCILSIKTHSSVDIRLGFHWRILYCICHMLVNHI